jgi:predicted ATPase
MLPRFCGWKPDDTPESRLGMLEGELARHSISLADTVPLLASLLSLPASERYPLPPMSPERQKRKTLEALIAAFLGIARESPLLLIVEDLHWADPSTLELLTALLDQVATARILALFTARPSFALPWALRAHLMPLAVNRFTASRPR